MEQERSAARKRLLEQLLAAEKDRPRGGRAAPWRSWNFFWGKSWNGHDKDGSSQGMAERIACGFPVYAI